ncbi:MAG: plastocyanin/azurin family copper-binding protein, partial [Verrucomicrobiota bacterium]
RSELVAALASASHIRTLAAQRALLRLGLDDASVEALIALINDDTYDVESRVAAVFALTQGRPEDAFKNVDLLYLDPRVLPFVIRALGDVPLASGKDFDAIIDDVFAAEEPRAIMEAIYFAVQQNMQSHASQVAKHLASKDPVIRHTAYRGLVELSAHEAAFDQLDSEDIDTRKGAAWALMRMHKKEVVDELISRLENTTSIDKRRPLISVLARLYHKEDTWTGDSWGTRPDTRGPYYTLTTWEQSDRILEVLRGLLNDAEDEEAGFTLTKLSKNRIPANDSLDRMIQIALADKTKAPAAVSQMANSGDLPEKAIPVVLGVAESPESSSGALADVVKLLIDSDYKDGLPAILKALGRLSSMTGVGKDVDAASKAFLNAPKLENHHTALENLLHTEPQTVSGKWAAKAVLKLAARKGGAPESREMTQKAIEKAWQDKFQKIALLEAARDLRHREFKSKILMAASDADKDVAKAAVSAARRLKIEIPKQVKSDGTSVEVVALLGQLKFDKKKIEIPVGKTIKLTLMNPDKMAHNLVIVQPGKEKEVAAAAVALGAEGFAKGWLPDHSAIIAATKMLNYDEDDTIEFKIDKAGEYPFICSFPGHELTMVGVIIAK